MIDAIMNGAFDGKPTGPDREPLTWRWPYPPQRLKVYDKYADIEAELAIDAPTWIVPVQGGRERFEFWPGGNGQLQRTFVALTQTKTSPSAIVKLTRSLLKNWELVLTLLLGGPEGLQRQWAESVHGIDTAKAAKTVLRLACTASAGPWRHQHQDLIRGLDHRSGTMLLKLRAAHRRREKLLPIDVQAALTHALDEGAVDTDVSDTALEGLVALALMFQHGVRPVQVLTLRVEHVRLIRDASVDLACIVSFHKAKQRPGKRQLVLEMARQVKQEWVPLIERQLRVAHAAGRSRLFKSTTADRLGNLVSAIAKKRGINFEFSPNFLRHTGAQSLADAGHDRASIRSFLGHSKDNASSVYVNASRNQGELINVALGASKLYDRVLSIAEGKFVSVDTMLAAEEDQQIGAVVGERLVAGVGLCKSGQPSCPYNPVTSCYGCIKFIPSLDRASHQDAVAGMRDQVRIYLALGDQVSPAYLQLTRALSGAQQALEVISRMKGEASL